MRTLLPLILLVAAIGLFVGYTNNAYQGSKSVAAETVSYDQALTTAGKLKSQRDQLLSKRATFSTDDVQKLERMLPDNVDNIRLIIDINNIAARHGLTLKNVSLGTVSSASTARSAVAVGASGDPVGSVNLGFTVTASYDKFLSFLADLEHSLRVVDVEKLNFKIGDIKIDANDYALTIRTYWLH
ncbi:MAG: type 4a pilus biogenesis protein PilO [Patescibacteria group bacterium]